jgi:glycosyltransferase involved in cell wall biosynthesis
MYEGDAFIGTCRGDAKCMHLSFSNAKIYNIPYPYFPISTKQSSMPEEKLFVFIGRLSDQKNIHLLIESYKKLLDLNPLAPKMLIYGEEDFLGWPNLGIPATHYLEVITALIDKYKLHHKIIMKGFQPRELIYSNLGEGHIFISASTHSDENFGMAALRSLAVGGKLVLSSWGGHKEFKEHCPDRVWLSDVVFEYSRPQITSDNFALKLSESLKANIEKKTSALPEYFMPINISIRFNSILNNLRFTDKALIPTDLGKKISQQQIQFEREGEIQKSFRGFDDPLLLKLLLAYAQD